MDLESSIMTPEKLNLVVTKMDKTAELAESGSISYAEKVMRFAEFGIAIELGWVCWECLTEEEADVAREHLKELRSRT